MADKYRINNVEMVGTIIPKESSGGTGYSEYAKLRVSFCGRDAVDVCVSYYYASVESIFKEFLESIPGCDNIEESYGLFCRAMHGIIGDVCSFSELPEHLREPVFKRKPKKIYRIRKLTPRECFRLMGVSDADVDKIQHYPRVSDGNGGWVLPGGMTEAEEKKLKISESQQYKMAGNSIVVQVLEGIFTQLLREDSDCLF